MKKAKKVRIFFDMDGVLAKWTPVEIFEQLFEENWFKNLERQDWSIKGLIAIQDLLPRLLKDQDVEVDYYVLTACVDSPYAIPEKSEWLDKNFPVENRIYVDNGDNKAEYVHDISKYDILIDDYSHNLHRWEESGGTGIKLMNGVNGNYGTWTGPCIRENATTGEILEVLYNEIKKL